MRAEQRPTPRRAALSRLAAPLFVAVVVQSAANLVFHAVVGRALTPPEYGALGTVLAAMTLVAVPLSALQTASARATATQGLNGATARHVLWRTTLFTTPVALALALAAVPIAHFLRLESVWDALVLAPTLLVAALIAAVRGLLLGVGRSTVVAGSYVVSTLVRLGPGLVLAVWAGVTGALLGTLLAEVCALVWVATAAWRSGGGVVARFSGGDYVRTAAVVAGLFVFTTVDLFLARHFLAPAASGGYVAAATIGKTVLALPAAAISVAYPRLVAAWSEGGRSRALRSALVVVGGPALLVAAIVALVPGLVLTVLYGSGTYDDAISVTRVLALVAGVNALVSVLVHAGLARVAWTQWLPWAGAAVQVGLIVVWHDSGLAVAWCSAAAAVGLVLALVVLEAPAWRRPAGVP